MSRIQRVLKGLGPGPHEPVGIDPYAVFTAVFNGIASVPLIFLVNRIACVRELMGDEVSGTWSRIGVWAAFIGISAAAVGAVVTFRGWA